VVLPNWALFGPFRTVAELAIGLGLIFGVATRLAADPTIGATKRVRGLRLVATDLDWTVGTGPAVKGPAESLLMSMAGRRGVVGELAGPGQPTLAARVER